MHPAKALWNRHHPAAGYPAGVLPVPEPIPGIAFFPGGFGLWRPDIARPLPEFPVGGVMVLGHDFHSEAGYRASLSRTRESATQPTWRNLISVLTEAGITVERCFFTNVYMGLRAGDGTTGPFPGERDVAFVAHCINFLQDQIETQRPGLILTLGVNAPRVLAALAPELDAWKKARTLRDLDAEPGAVRSEVSIDGIAGFRTTVVALTHPSLRAAGVRYRLYGGESGHQAELAMLRDAVRPRDRR